MMTGWDRNQTLSPTLSSDHAVSLSVAHFRSSILKEPQPLRWNSSAENSSIALLGSPSPLCRLLVQQGHAVSQSNYMSIKGFVAQDSFCQASAVAGLEDSAEREWMRYHFMWRSAERRPWKGGLGGKRLPSLSPSLCQWATVPPPAPTRTTPSIL